MATNSILSAVPPPFQPFTPAKSASSSLSVGTASLPGGSSRSEFPESRVRAVETVSLPDARKLSNMAVVDNGKQLESNRGSDSVLFEYNFKGDLRVKFMDSFNNLIYQMPSEQYTRMSDILERPRSSVDTKV
jgi:hypothetical protein